MSPSRPDAIIPVCRMRLPVEWIREYAPVEASTAEIAGALTMAGLEVEETARSEAGDVLDIKVTPNRGDCLSVVGVARELAAAKRIAMREPPQPVSRGAGPEPVSVRIENPEGCPRYSARLIRKVRSVPSPAWLQERLTAAGMRPIGGIVDVTNYVMLELGQPLHAFDFDTLRGPEIVVRNARDGERLTTLDGVEREVTPRMLMICDAERPVAVAGVMGGAQTEIGGSTQNVLLESAHFNPLSVRGTSKALGLRTEASYRFERFVDPEIVVAAADRACTLIRELGMGEPVEGVADVYPYPRGRRNVSLRIERASRLLGFDVSEADVRSSLESLGFLLQDAGRGRFTVSVPSRRPDIVREEDLVEEVGRVVGYEGIPEKLPAGASTQGGDSAGARFAEQVREALAGAGLQEIISHSLLAPDPFEDARIDGERVNIRSALSAELSGLRRSLLPGLIDALERNARRGQAPLAFFEIGRVFRMDGGEVTEFPSVALALSGPLEPPSWARGRHSADFFLVRGMLERMAASLRLPDFRFDAGNDPRLHPGRSAAIHVNSRRIGTIGELHPSLAADLTARERVVIAELALDPLIRAAADAPGFQLLSPYPSITRDIAPRVPMPTPYAEVERAVVSAEAASLERIALTDVFSGPPLPEGVKSLTLSLTFRSTERTLTDEEINAALDRIRESLETSCGAVFSG